MSPLVPPASPPAKLRRKWPLLIILPVMALTYLLQSMFLLCACSTGRPSMNAGQILDALILLRVAAAVIRQERNNHWIIYLVLATWSVAWIPLVFST